MKDLIIDGVPMRDPQGQWTIDYTRSQLLADLSRRYEAASVYGYHGGIVDTESYFGTGKEMFVLNLIAQNKDQMAAYLRSLTGLLLRPELVCYAAPQRSPLSGPGDSRVGRSFGVSDDLIKTAVCRLSGGVIPEYINETTYRLKMVLEKIQAFWFSKVEYLSPVVTLDNSQILNLDTVLGGANAPITKGKFRVKGPLSIGATVTVMDGANTRRSIGLQVSGTAVTSSQWVVVDFESGKARVSENDSWDLAGTNVDRWVRVVGDGPFFLSPNFNFDIVATGFSYEARIAPGSAQEANLQFLLRRSYTS